MKYPNVIRKCENITDITDFLDMVSFTLKLFEIGGGQTSKGVCCLHKTERTFLFSRPDDI